MSEQLVRKVAIAALKGERGEGGWLKIDAPKATDKEIPPRPRKLIQRTARHNP